MFKRSSPLSPCSVESRVFDEYEPDVATGLHPHKPHGMNLPRPSIRTTIRIEKVGIWEYARFQGIQYLTLPMNAMLRSPQLKPLHLFIYYQLIFFPVNIFLIGWLFGYVFFVMTILVNFLPKRIYIAINIVIIGSLGLLCHWDSFITGYFCTAYMIGLYLYGYGISTIKNTDTV